ncbi:hypothetical protein B2J93_2204 [Marssonina coronariae]|uniref:Uncharacterized protein n=1 Tax=Diplocarpon coronariae TaxID=2795749 RepID=A0A218Z7E8_9HELO|nr:hypothetical protein B2J93_2204 [Marssonina coronariae]
MSKHAKQSTRGDTYAKIRCVQDLTSPLHYSSLRLHDESTGMRMSLVAMREDRAPTRASESYADGVAHPALWPDVEKSREDIESPADQPEPTESTPPPDDQSGWQEQCRARSLSCQEPAFVVSIPKSKVLECDPATASHWMPQPPGFFRTSAERWGRKRCLVSLAIRSRGTFALEVRWDSGGLLYPVHPR